MNKFVLGAVGVVAAVGMVLVPVVGANAAEGTPEGGFVTTAWNMPSWSAPNVATWPQTLNQYAVTDVPDLGALDSRLASSVPCGTTAQFQVDVYKSGEVTDSLLAGKTLTSPNVPTEALIAGGWGVAYKVVQIVGAECPVVVPLPASLDHMDVCGPEYVLSVPESSDSVTWSDDRATSVVNGVGDVTVTAKAQPGYVLTADGETSSDVFTWGYSFTNDVCPETAIPPVVDAPVVPPVVETAPVRDEAQLPTPDTLAFTGPSPYAGWFAGAAGLLLAAGGALMFVGRKKVSA